MPESQDPLPKAMLVGVASVLANVHCNGVEPGRKTRLEPEALDRSEHLYESLLRALFGIAVLAEQPIAKVEYAILVPQYQPVQTPAISR